MTRTPPRSCRECRQHAAAPGRNMCESCLLEYAAAQRRRREAERRMPPLRADELDTRELVNA